MAGREGLQPLLDNGVIDAVLRPLMSGKEAQVWLVEARGELRVAKIYKQAEYRSFKHRSVYTEGRQARRSRDQRAMKKGSRYGKEQVEAAWRSAEVDAIYRLRAAGVRVPEPFDFVDGVLVMELVRGEDGGPAPRLADVNLSRREAKDMHHLLVHQVVRMLDAGLVHGDLSDFNVLLGQDGPVIIDFPQAIDAAANQNARKLLLRDLKNLKQFFSRWAPELRKTRYGAELWAHYERGTLTAETQLTGTFKRDDQVADVDAIVAEIRAAEAEARARRQALGLPEPRPARTPIVSKGPPPRPIDDKGKPKGGSKGSRGPARDSAEHEDRPRKKRRRRRRRKGRGGSSGEQPAPPRKNPPPSSRSERREPPPSESKGSGGDDLFDDLDALLSED